MVEYLTIEQEIERDRYNYIHNGRNELIEKWLRYCNSDYETYLLYRTQKEYSQ